MCFSVRMFTKISDAAEQLSVSERFLYQLITENRIPFYRLSKRTLRVDLKELRSYMRLIAEGKPMHRQPMGESAQEKSEV